MNKEVPMNAFRILWQAAYPPKSGQPVLIRLSVDASPASSDVRIGQRLEMIPGGLPALVMGFGLDWIEITKEAFLMKMNDGLGPLRMLYRPRQIMEPEPPRQAGLSRMEMLEL